jgi:Ca-activated chloride channel homolog
VVGFANSVLLVQDFTADQNQISQAIGLLAPAGGTALWDAVSFAADKLASRPEEMPVARMLVVISDGADNSSSTTLREAIESAGRDEVIVYAVSTRDERDAATDFDHSFVGDHALKVLSEGTGGTAFFPGSLRRLDHGLAELQQVIRGRYLISYKPEELKQDGRYRSIDIGANKSGHKLRVYARKGYYARSSPDAQNN